MLRWSLITLASLAFSLPSRETRADSDLHYQDVLIGDRAAGMGGANVALGGEATSAYYNPAGILVERSTLIQLSMSAYSFRKKRSSAAKLCQQEVFEDDSGFFSFPASVGFVKLFGSSLRQAIGLTLTIPAIDKASQASVDRNIRCGGISLDSGISRILVDRVFRAGLSYAVRPWPGLQLGVTIGLAARGVSQTTMAILLQSTPSSQSYPAVNLLNAEATLWNIYAQLGAIFSPHPRLRVGLALTTPYLALNEKGTIDTLTSSLDPADWRSSAGVALDEATFRWKVPLRIRLGLAYVLPKKLALAVEASLNLPAAAYTVVEHPQLPADIVDPLQRDLVVNVNAGAEIYLTPTLALRLGFFTNLTSHPALETVTSAFGDHVDHLGASLGASYASSKQSIIALTIQGQVGFGQSQRLTISETQDPAAPLAESIELADVSAFSLIISIGGRVELQ